MNFDSHTSDVVAATVRVVNLLTPGHARGRDYRAAPSAAQVAEATRLSVTALSPVEIDRLREYALRLREVFTAVDRDDLDAACERTNALLRDTQATPVLTRHDGEAWHLHFHTAESDLATGLAASLATGIAVVLGNPMADRLGVCTAPACDRVFVDTSRNGLRRFCSTACQNRVKSAAFRARQRS